MMKSSDERWGKSFERSLEGRGESAARRAAGVGRSLWLRRAASLLVLLAPMTIAAPAAAAETIVTALSGAALANGEALEIDEQLGDAAEVAVETDDWSACSLLHGDSLLVELGPSTKVRLQGGLGDQGAVVSIESGEARVTVQRQRSTPKPEIRTPTAVVRPTSSVVHVSVDAVTGDTSVTSLESRALVVSSDPVLKRSALLNTSQWVGVPRGQPPGAIQKLDERSAAEMASRFSSASLRYSALGLHGQREGRVLLDRIAESDIPSAEFAAVASPLPVPPGFGFSWDNPRRPDAGCNPTSCGLTLGLPELGPALPPICTGIPGEQCQR